MKINIKLVSKDGLGFQTVEPEAVLLEEDRSLTLIIKTEKSFEMNPDYTEMLAMNMATRIVDNVIPLFAANLAGLGMSEQMTQLCVNAYLDAINEDSEIMLAQSKQREKH